MCFDPRTALRFCPSASLQRRGTDGKRGTRDGVGRGPAADKREQQQQRAGGQARGKGARTVECVGGWRCRQAPWPSKRWICLPVSILVDWGNVFFFCPYERPGLHPNRAASRSLPLSLSPSPFPILWHVDAPVCAGSMALPTLLILFIPVLHSCMRPKSNQLWVGKRAGCTARAAMQV